MTTDIDFEGRSVAHSDDPWSRYAEIRERTPILWSEKRECWYLFRHADGYSLWWEGPGATRQATKGPIVRHLKKAWRATRAIEHIRPQCVIVYMELFT